MRTPRLPVVDWTDTPANLNWLVRFAERPNLVSARVLSRSERTILSTRTHRIPHCSCYSLHKLVRCVSQKHGVTVCPSCAQWPVCQQRSTGWSIPCASSYLMNRDLQIASHFKWGWAFVLDVPTLLVTYHHTHSDPSNFIVLMLLGMRVGSCDPSFTSRIAEFSWNIYIFQTHLCSECTHYV